MQPASLWHNRILIHLLAAHQQDALKRIVFIKVSFSIDGAIKVSERLVFCSDIKYITNVSNPRFLVV